jgi:imidazoleglycerol phosphate dehydratase HisB
MSDQARGSEPTLPRQARVERKTKETQIVLQLNVDGTGASKVETTIPFFDHMLEAWSKHGLMDLAVDARGDIEVDLHHTVEDVGICLGKALKDALGDKRGIVRYGACRWTKRCCTPPWTSRAARTSSSTCPCSGPGSRISTWIS